MLRSLLLGVLFAFFALTTSCFAVVGLSVNPVDGSNSLRFDKVSAFPGGKNQEIHIRVSSPNDSRYQVFQRILEPLANEKGEVLNLQSIQTETLANSNASGTLYLQNLDRVSMSDQLLYTSSQGGESDSFIVGYSLNKSLINEGGNFRGRIVYSVRAVGDASSDEVTLDVLIETASPLKIIVKGAHELDRIHVKGDDTTQKTADFVNISFTGNSGQTIRVYQEINDLPQDEAEQALGSDVLLTDVQGESEGLKAQGQASLKSARTLIYSSNKDQDNFLVYFLLNADKLKVQGAGSYRGKVKYIVETDQGRQEFPLDVQCDIPSIFEMIVLTPPGGVKFAHVLASNPPQEREVLVTIISNLHKPYQVLQDLQNGLTNEKGKVFDSKYFTFQVQVPLEQKGQSDFTVFSPVQTGEYPVLSSDAMGDSIIFKVVYRLQGYPLMSPGDYSVPVRFSLNQK